MRKSLSLLFTLSLISIGPAFGQTEMETGDEGVTLGEVHPLSDKPWSVSVGYERQEADFKGESNVAGETDFNGIALAAGRDFGLGGMWSTTSRIKGYYGESEGAFLDDDFSNWNIGLEQSINFDIEAANTIVRPFASLGIGYGMYDRELTIGPASVEGDSDYYRGVAGAGVSVILPNGLAPFAKYEYSVSELDDDDFNSDDFGDFSEDVDSDAFIVGLNFHL